MLDLHRLRVLRSVVTSGSVAGAASNLGYTSSAVSQHLAALQRETGLVLLERSGRGVRPTAAGLALAQEADALLARLGEAETRVADLRSSRSSALTIAYFASVGAVWLPEVVAGLLEAVPHVRLSLRLVNEPPDDPGERADVQLVGRAQPFDGSDLAVGHRANLAGAGVGGLAVDQHHAAAALLQAAAVARAGAWGTARPPSSAGAPTTRGRS